MSQTITTVTTVTTSPPLRMTNGQRNNHDPNRDPPRLPSTLDPLERPPRTRKAPIRYTDDHHDIIMDWFHDNWSLYYDHRRGNGTSTNGAIAQLRKYLLDQISARNLAPIPEELLTDQALIEKWGRMYRDMAGSAIARRLNRTVPTGAGVNFLAPEGEDQGIPMENLTRREQQHMRLWFLFRGTPTSNPPAVLDIGAVPDAVDPDNGVAPGELVPNNNTRDDDETISDLHHLFAVPSSPFPFLPDDEGQSSSSLQHHAHPFSTQTTVQNEEEEEEVVEEQGEEEDLDDGEYVVVRNVVDKGKGVASSSSSQASFIQPASHSSSSLSSSSRISHSQLGTRPATHLSSLSSSSQSASRMPMHSSSLSPSSPSRISSSQSSARPAAHISASSSSSQSSRRAPTRPVSSPQANGKRRGTSHSLSTHAANQTSQAESSQAAQLRNGSDGQDELHRYVQARLAFHAERSPAIEARERLERLVEERLQDALGRPAPSGRTHPAYTTNNPLEAAPPLPNPSQRSATPQSLSSSLVRYTESKLSMHQDRMHMQGQKMEILQTAVKCLEILLTGERPTKRVRHNRNERIRDEDVDEPETEDDPENEDDFE